MLKLFLVVMSMKDRWDWLDTQELLDWTKKYRTLLRNPTKIAYLGNAKGLGISKISCLKAKSFLISSISRRIKVNRQEKNQGFQASSQLHSLNIINNWFFVFNYHHFQVLKAFSGQSCRVFLRASYLSSECLLELNLRVLLKYFGRLREFLLISLCLALWGKYHATRPTMLE